MSSLDSPRAQMLARAAQEVAIVDARGRQITLRKPGILAQFRILEAAGDSATNLTYVNMVLPLIFVAAIDGETVAQPATKTDLEALISRLDEEGIEAVMRGVGESFGASDPEADKEAIRRIGKSAPVREALWLMRHGVDVDLAFGMDDVTRAAWSIIFCEQEGGKFNWQRMEFEDQP
jgi:hypothetical protein